MVKILVMSFNRLQNTIFSISQRFELFEYNNFSLIKHECYIKKIINNKNDLI